MAAEGLPMSKPPSMAAMGPDWYQSGPGLVIEFCTSLGRTGNSTYQKYPSIAVNRLQASSQAFPSLKSGVVFRLLLIQRWRSTSLKKRDKIVPPSFKGVLQQTFFYFN